jgi:hypothetical protein
MNALLALVLVLSALLYLWLRHRWAVRVVDEWERRIQHAGAGRCADCKELITPENDSGWHVFVGPHTVQPICKACDAKRAAEMTGAKAPEPG